MFRKKTEIKDISLTTNYHTLCYHDFKNLVGLRIDKNNVYHVKDPFRLSRQLYLLVDTQLCKEGTIIIKQPLTLRKEITKGFFKTIEKIYIPQNDKALFISKPVNTLKSQLEKLTKTEEFLHYEAHISKDKDAINLMYHLGDDSVFNFIVYNCFIDNVYIGPHHNELIGIANHANSESYGKLHIEALSLDDYLKMIYPKLYDHILTKEEHITNYKKVLELVIQSYKNPLENELA